MWTISIPVSTGLVDIVVPVGVAVGIDSVGIDSVGVPVGVGVIILHSTWEGFGLHLPSLPHVALRYDGISPDC